MSTQTILHKTEDRLYVDTLNILSCMGDKYLLNKKFGLGDSYNRDDFKKISWLQRLLCGNYCGLASIRDKVREQLNFLNLRYQ